MKKLVITLAGVAFATYVQAAAIRWQTGNLVDHTGAGLSRSELYTAQVFFYSDATGTTDISAGFAGTLTDSTADKNGGYFATTKNSGIESGTYYAKVVITGNADGAGEGWTLTSDIGEFTYNSASQSQLTINFSSGLNMGGNSLLDNSGENYGWTKVGGDTGGGTDGVPEPTSGLLLLIGAAGLALRRKQK